MELLIGTLIIVASLIALVKIFEMETKVELAKLSKEEDPKKETLEKR